MSVVPVPSSVVSGCDAMSFTARESAFSIAFGRHVAGVGDIAQALDRARARDLAADVPAHAVGHDEERELGEHGVLVDVATTSGVRRGGPVELEGAAGHGRRSGTGWILRARPVPPVIRRTSRGRTAGRRAHILVAFRPSTPRNRRSAPATASATADGGAPASTRRGIRSSSSIGRLELRVVEAPVGALARRAARRASPARRSRRPPSRG